MGSSHNNSRKSSSGDADRNFAGKPVVGLDFGTSNTSIAKSIGSKVEILQSDRHTHTPSIVAFDGDRILIGDETTASTIKPENIIFGMKRLLGLSFKELEQKNYSVQPFEIKNDQNTPLILVEGKEFHVEQIVAFFFSKLKDAIPDGQAIKRAVLTVSSSFGISQQKALLDAAKIAGISFCRLIKETTAAAIAFCYKQKDTNRNNVLIFQLGGGTIDVAIFCIEGRDIKLLSSVASCDIGGEDLTRQIMDFVFKHSSSLRLASEKAKTDLAGGDKTKIKMVEEELKYSKQSFEAANKKFTEIFKWMIQFVIDAAGLSCDQIDKYFVTGRSTTMPTVTNILKKCIGEEKRKYIVNAGDAAVSGAAIYAELLSKGKNVTSVSDNLPVEKIIISKGKVFSNYKQVLAASALQKQLDNLEKIARLDHELELEFTVHAQTATGLSEKKLKEMAENVAKLREADKNYLVDEKEKNKFTTALHKLEDEIEELDKTSGDNEKLKSWHEECKAFDEWICDGKNISKETLDVNQKRLEKITTEMGGLKVELNLALEKAKYDLTMILGRIKSSNKQDSRTYRKCEEFALNLKRKKKITLPEVKKMNNEILAFEKEERRKALQKAKDELKSTLDEIKRRNKKDSEITKKCEEIAEWHQRNEEVDILQIEERKQEVLNFEKQMRKERRNALQKAKDELNSTLDEIKSRNNQDSEVFKKCKIIAEWLQDNEEVELSMIQERRKYIVKFEEEENRKALQEAKDELNSKLYEIISRNNEDVGVVKECAKIGKWLQQNKETEISKIKKKKEYIVNFESDMKEKRRKALKEAKDDLKIKLDEVRDRNNQSPQVIKRCKQIEKSLQQNEKVDMSAIQEKKNEIVKFEKEEKHKALQEAKDDLNSTLKEIEDRNMEDSTVIEKCKEIEKWLQDNEEATMSTILEKKKEVEEFEQIVKTKDSPQA